MPSRKRILGCLLWLMLTGILLAGILAGFWWMNAILFKPTVPQVRITRLEPAGIITTHTPSFIFAEASDPEGIASVELWVNGKLIATQVNPDPHTAAPFFASQAWRPNGAGVYTLLIRAVDSRGYAGNSDTHLVEAVQWSQGASLSNQYIVEEGDTIASIAESFGITPEALRESNPELGSAEPSPGDSLTVPLPPESDSSADAPPVSDDAPPGSEEAIPTVEPAGESPAEPLPPADDHPAEPRIPPLGLPVDFASPGLLGDFCDGFPSLFGCPRFPRAGGSAPAVPLIISARLEGCSVEIRWSDDASDEDGYNVYRQAQGAPVPELIMAAVPDSNSMVDVPSSPGLYRYYVEVFNESGSSASSSTEEVEIPSGCGLLYIGTSIDVEALELNTSGTYDRLYCYVSLAGAPYERVPREMDQFILNVGGHWNIAEHFSGANKVSLFVPRDQPLDVSAECLGWQGSELINLGRFGRSHPSSEWDGRPLTGEAGLFSVVYHIQPHTESALYPIIDPGLPVPYNLRRVDSWSDCPRRESDMTPCAVVEEPGLAWDWDAPAGRTAYAFAVLRREPDEPSARALDAAFWPSQSASLDTYCVESAYYSIQVSLNERDPATGDTVQSRVSDEVLIEHLCNAHIFVWLLSLRTGTLDDGCAGFICTSTDRTFESYGHIWVNDVTITWNDHCEAGFNEGCVTSAPDTTSIGSNREYSWRDMWLSIAGAYAPHSGYLNNHNLAIIQLGRGSSMSPLTIGFDLIDYDSVSHNDRWCMQRGFTLPARTFEEWDLTDETIEISASVSGEGSCTMVFRVQGIDRR